MGKGCKPFEPIFGYTALATVSTSLEVKVMINIFTVFIPICRPIMILLSYHARYKLHTINECRLL